MRTGRIQVAQLLQLLAVDAERELAAAAPLELYVEKGKTLSLTVILLQIDRKA